jgi:uncharacterized protein YegP (UPF0339 family)
MTHEGSKFIVYRELEDGYRWRLRAATGETLGASSRDHRDKFSCFEEMRSVMSEYPEAEILDVASD